MTSVFNLLFELFESVIGFLKEIPLTQNVSLFDFSLAILIMSIVVVAFVPVVTVGSTNTTNDILRADAVRHRQEKAESDRLARENERNSYETYRSNRLRKENYNRRYNEEMRL